MSKILEELKNIVTNSTLSGIDQNDLLIFLPVLPEKVLADLLDIFKKSPKMLKLFDEDFKAKLEALIDGRDAYQKMVDKETNLLDTWQEEFGKPEEIEENEKDFVEEKSQGKDNEDLIVPPDEEVDKEEF